MIIRLYLLLYYINYYIVFITYLEQLLLNVNYYLIPIISLY